MAFDKCVFEILAKLAASELTALCKFIDSKVAILDNELNKALAFSNSFTDQFNEVEARIRAGEDAFEGAIQGSSLLGIARELSPNCGSLANVFGGALDIAEITKTSVNDAVIAARQLVTGNGLIAAAKAEAENLISALRDLCRIVQLVILENATANITQFAGSTTQPFTKVLPKG